MEMDEQSKKSGEDGGFMIKVATFIVDRRNLFFLLFGIALIFSVVSMNWTTVENALGISAGHDRDEPGTGPHGGAVYHLWDCKSHGDKHFL